MRSKSSFNKCDDLDLNEIKSNQWQDKETDSLSDKEIVLTAELFSGDLVDRLLGVWRPCSPSAEDGLN